MKCFYFVLFLLPSFCFAQLTYNSDRSITYEEVVQIDSLSKNEIHKKVLSWFQKKYNSTNSEIRINSPEEILFNLVESIDYKVNGMPYPATIDFTMTTKLKDGKYKLIIEDLYSNINDFRKKVSDQQMTFEEYKIFYKSQIEEMEGYTKEAAEKMLKNDKQMITVYNVAMKSNKDIFENSKAAIIETVNSLKENLEGSDEDW